MLHVRNNCIVIPAQAGIQLLVSRQSWIPACAGMTKMEMRPQDAGVSHAFNR